jgi:hypothetical protein
LRRRLLVCFWLYSLAVLLLFFFSFPGFLQRIGVLVRRQAIHAIAILRVVGWLAGWLAGWLTVLRILF